MRLSTTKSYLNVVERYRDRQADIHELKYQAHKLWNSNSKRLLKSLIEIAESSITYNTV